MKSFPVSQDTGPIEASLCRKPSQTGHLVSMTFRCHKTPAPLKAVCGAAWMTGRARVTFPVSQDTGPIEACRR